MIFSDQIVFTLPSAPAQNTDPVSKVYADQIRTDILAMLQAMDPVASVRVACTTNVNLASPGANLDGVAMSVGDSFAVINQTTASQNGVYIYAGASSAATRRNDFDTTAKVTTNKSFFVDEGTAAGRMYRLSTTGAITLGSTNLTFVVAFTQASAVPVKANKFLTVNTTTADGNQATNTTVTGSPAANSHVMADVNGLIESVGDATKVGCAVYIS
ncbi:MAG: hypothetical protein EOO39_16300, partial [Cytophagaceae bacterium]